MRLTCWSDQRVVQSGQGAGLPLSQPHSDLLLDSPGFGPRVRRWAVRGNHVCCAGRGRLQSRQKAALRHSYTHLWRWFRAAGGTKVRAESGGAARPLDERVSSGVGCEMEISRSVGGTCGAGGPPQSTSRRDSSL